MSTELSRWADSAMYRSEGLSARWSVPQVTLLNATPDPLGSLATLCGMYEGKVIRSLAEVTDDDRRQAFANMLDTQLQGPLEVAQFHFLIEGVTRAFTHQMVRQREAFFAQESMRFAVAQGQDWTDRARHPESIETDSRRLIWERAIEAAQDAYDELIDAGVPAEDARGVMPHDMTTRLHWVLDLRGLLHVAGLRLCTQAQFEWRSVMAQVVKALRAYGKTQIYHERGGGQIWSRDANWQFELIAEALRPVCYQQGRCGFMAKFDRGCTIRDRVEANARVGRPSSRWDEDFRENDADCDAAPGEECACTVTTIKAIRPEEWAADPNAARVRP